MSGHVHSALDGTKTADNLMSAFTAEARAFTKYNLYADAAQRQGDLPLARLLRDIAGNEKEHAELWMEYMGELREADKNLDAMLAGEEYESRVLYPEYSKMAAEEGFSELADKFSMAAVAEKRHGNTLADHLESKANGTRFQGDEETDWLCTSCGYIHHGKGAPDRCPLCNYPKEYYVKD